MSELCCEQDEKARERLDKKDLADHMSKDSRKLCCPENRQRLEERKGVDKVMQQLRAPTVKSDSLSLTPRTHRVE